MWQTPDTTPLFCYLIIELRSQPFKDDRTLRSEIHPTTAIIGRSRLSMFCSPRRGEEKRRTISVASLTSHSTEIESFSPPFGAIWGRGSDGSRIVLRYRQKGERYSSSKEFVVPFNPISFFFLHFFLLISLICFGCRSSLQRLPDGPEVHSDHLHFEWNRELLFWFRLLLFRLWLFLKYLRFSSL